jgi:hypothetical protein
MTSPHTPLLSRIEQMIPPLLAEIAPEVELTWCLAFQALPDEGSTPNGPAWMPVLVIYLEVPLGTDNSYYSVSLLAPFRLTEDQLRKALSEAVHELTGRQGEYWAARSVAAGNSRPGVDQPH